MSYSKVMHITADPAAPIVCLIVDDEPEILEGLKRKFLRNGFAVFTESSGQAALARCGTTRIDVLITDIRMPHMTGMELLESVMLLLREQCPAVICMSAYSDVTLEGIYNKGADALFPKPIDTEALMAAVVHFHHARLQRLSRWEAKS